MGTYPVYVNIKIDNFSPHIWQTAATKTAKAVHPAFPNKYIFFLSHGAQKYLKKYCLACLLDAEEVDIVSSQFSIQKTCIR